MDLPAWILFSVVLKLLAFGHQAARKSVFARRVQLHRGLCAHLRGVHGIGSAFRVFRLDQSLGEHFAVGVPDQAVVHAPLHCLVVKDCGLCLQTVKQHQRQNQADNSSHGCLHLQTRKGKSEGLLIIENIFLEY